MLASIIHLLEHGLDELSDFLGALAFLVFLLLQVEHLVPDHIGDVDRGAIVFQEAIEQEPASLGRGQVEGVGVGLVAL